MGGHHIFLSCEVFSCVEFPKDTKNYYSTRIFCTGKRL